MIPHFLRHRPFLPLTTEQLILRPPRQEDAPALKDLELYSLQEAEDKIAASMKMFQKGEALFLVVEHLLEGYVMGTLEIGQHFACALGERFQKKGYGHEAASAFIHFIFSLLEVEEIVAITASPSQRFLEKLGFCLKSVATEGAVFHLTREAFFKSLFCKRKRTLIWVVVGALIREDGALFLARRQTHQSFPGAWELPGGKIEPDESPETAMIREMEEEVGVTIAPHQLKPLSFASYPYKTVHIVLHFYACFDWKGEPCGKEGQEVAWVFPEELHCYPTPAASIFLLNRLADELATQHPRWKYFVQERSFLQL